MAKPQNTTHGAQPANDKTQNDPNCRTFDLRWIMKGVSDACYVEVSGDRLSEVCDGDILVVDCARSPEDGELVVWEHRHGKGRTVGYYYEDDQGDGDVVLGVAAALIRRFHVETGKRINRRKQTFQSGSVEDMRERLSKLERVPENEGERFRLETEIHRLEQESESDEWPEVVAA